MKARLLLLIDDLLLELMMLRNNLVRIETLELGRVLVGCRVGGLDASERTRKELLGRLVLGRKEALSYHR